MHERPRHAVPRRLTLSVKAERRALQGVVAIACLVPIIAGGAGVWAGARMIKHFAASSPDLDSHFRYLSGLLLGIGLAFATMIPSIERHKRLFATLGLIVMVGGAGRPLSALRDGSPYGSHRYALIMELVVMPLLILWQRRVANQASAAASHATPNDRP